MLGNVELGLRAFLKDGLLIVRRLLSLFASGVKNIVLIVCCGSCVILLGIASIHMARLLLLLLL